jgi:hypothetical protein
MNFKEISTAEAKKHPEYGFGGGLYLVYVFAIIWCLHSVYIVFLDADYELVLFYAPRLNPVMPSVTVSLFSVNWMVWFTFGMISPRAIPVAIVVSLVSAFMIIYIMRSTRVNVTYRNRVPE